MLRHQNEDTTLDLPELKRLSAWYRAFISSKYAVVEVADIVLDAKLTALTREIEARQHAVAVAARERTARQQHQHVGVERRTRAEAPVAPRRIMRPVACTH